MNSKALSKRRDQMRHKTNSFVQTSRNSCLWELSRTERFPTPELFLFKPFMIRSPFMILWLHHILVVISNAPSVSSSTSSMSPPGFDVVPFSLAVSLSTWNKNMDIIYLLVTTSVLWHKFFPTTFVTSKEQRKTLIFKLIKMTNFELDRRISHWLAYWSTSFLCWNHFISKMIGGER